MTPLTEPGKRGKRLTPKQKQAVIVGVTAGRSQKDVALELGVNPDTVSKIARNSLGDGWRRTFEDARQPIAETIVKSATDQEDVHRAANTGLALFKGLGLLNGDKGDTVINVLNVVNQALPQDMQFDLVSTPGLEDSTPEIRDITPET